MTENHLLKKYKAERAIELKAREAHSSILSEEELYKAYALGGENLLQYFEKDFPGVSILEIEAVIYNFNFDFLAVQKFLNTLPNLADKLRFLCEIKADFERKSNNEFGWVKKHIQNNVLRFGKECQIEIEKIKELQQIDKQEKELDVLQWQKREIILNDVRKSLLDMGMPNNPQQIQNHSNEIQKHKGLNRESAFLFFEYLFNYANIDCKNIEKAKVIERLTGYSHKKIVSLFSWLEKEKLETEEKKEADKKFFDDMNFVRDCFELLGLEEITEKIDKDLGNESG